MATTQELIQGLVENRNALQAQVDALNAAIAALGGVVSAPVAAAKPAAPKAAAPAAPAAEAPAPSKRGRKPGSKNAAPSAKEEKEAGTRGGRKAAPINIVDNYADAKSWNEKVIWALKQKPKATAEDITTLIGNHEPEMNLEKLKVMVSSYASTLTKRGFVNAKREGRGYVYSYTGKTE